VIPRILQAIRVSITPRREAGAAGRVEPRLKTVALAMFWAAAMVSWKPLELAVLVAVLAVSALMTLGSRVTGYALAVSGIGGLGVFLVTLVFSPLPLWEGGLYRSIALAVRAYTVSAYTLLFAVTTNPLILAESLGLRGKVYDYVVISSRSLPLVLQMAEEAYVALKRTGRPLHRTALPVLVESTRRAGYLAESLFLRGYGLHSSPHGKTRYDWSIPWSILTLASAALSLVVGVLV